MKKFLVILAGVIFAAVLFFFFKVNQFYEKIYIPKKLSLPTTSPEKTAYNILILGYGGGIHEGAYLTDTIIVAHVDLANKKTVLISLPRDIWAKVPTKSKKSLHAKINAVYEMELYPKEFPDIDKRFVDENGSPDLVETVVSNITGITIDNFIAIDFAGFVQAIDTLGGVDINVPHPFDDERYPIEGKEKDLCGKTEEDLPELEKIATQEPQLAFPCRYEHIHFDAGLQHMNGETALKYARSRYSKQDGGDFERARRQQILIEAVKDKIFSIGFIPKIIPLLDELSTHIHTDVPFNITQKFLSEAKNSNQYALKSVVLTDNDYLKSARSDNGQFILIPNEGIDKWAKVKVWIKNQIEN